MKIEIEISEESVIKMVEKIVAEKAINESCVMLHNAKQGVRAGIDKAVKAYIYDQKDRIIERCVDRASAELVRKGLPKLLERDLS